MSTQAAKERQLRLYKARATALLLLMAGIFIITTIYHTADSPSWLGYLRAFAEAATVGALADWYAVTAIFHHPLGLKIPHTNIIRRKKQQIGDNLGEFMVDKFLSDDNVRPYIQKLQFSTLITTWLSKKSSQDILVTESASLILDSIQTMDEHAVVAFIKQQSKALSDGIALHQLLASSIDFLIDKHWHHALIQIISREIRNYIVFNHKSIYQMVQDKSHTLVPKAIDRKIAKEITLALITYLLELENDPKHPAYKTIPQKLLALKQELLTNKEWQQQLQTFKDEWMHNDKLERMAYQLWYHLKHSAVLAAEDDASVLHQQLRRQIKKLVAELQQDSAWQQRLDPWLQKKAYRYFRKNRHLIARFISTTVGQWDAEKLNRTLELEVAKDLQWIRINGTIVGGLVGLLLHALSTWL
ncbi:DUF445 domain-containing protein [Oligella urethralis]|uniref:Predicted membrane protein n=1 Tax=Oligella urethralis TaxID=90245 RepID=A0A2X1UKE0_9BURK|nr:DUF445 domain-containing protein [Oligella urethralis]SPY07632.1 Predicted membrane protein [Oligella urethralis]